jgi:hypothetical protein
MAGVPNAVITPQALKAKSAVAVAAKVTLNDAVNAVKLLDAGASGTAVYKLTALARATITATQLQLFRSPDNGVTMFFINNLLMAAYTVAATTAQTPSDFGYSETAPLRLQSGDSLWIGIGVALAAGVVFDATAEDL